MSRKDAAMPSEITTSTQFLLELFRLTKGDSSVQVATKDVGATVGLDKEAASKMSEDLIGEGWVEIKTLSGGIGITAEGVAAAQAAGAKAPDGGAQLSLGREPVLDTIGRTAVDRLTLEIKRHLATAPTPYAGLEEMVLDLKTLDIQLCSPRPKTAIVREILRSLQGNLDQAGATSIAQRLSAAIGKA
jgi:hypothetical protein